jgi:phage protein U
VFAVLGDILFQALTSPESFESKRDFDYAEHKIVQDRPRLQWTADALETVAFELMLHVNFVNPQSQLNALVAAARDHQARALVFGNGLHRGYFVLTSIAEVHKHSADDGSLIWATAKLDLKEYVIGAGFDPLAPPRPKTPPPAIVTAAPAPGGSGTGGSISGGIGGTPAAAPFNPNQPIGPNNLLPTSAILTLGALPANTYTQPAYPNAGVSAGVKNPNAPASAAGNLNYTAVPASAAVRAAP